MQKSLRSLEGLRRPAGSVIVDVGHQVCCYVHLAEGGDAPSRMCDVLQVSVSRRLCDDEQKLLRLVGVVGG